MTIEPSGNEPYLSISNITMELPIFFGEDARIGENQSFYNCDRISPKRRGSCGEGDSFVKRPLSDLEYFVYLNASK
jgi:hypothetical protein